MSIVVVLSLASDSSELNLRFKSLVWISAKHQTVVSLDAHVLIEVLRCYRLLLLLSLAMHVLNLTLSVLKLLHVVADFVVHPLEFIVLAILESVSIMRMVKRTLGLQSHQVRNVIV